MNKISLHSARVTKGSRTYFFDAKVSIYGVPYVTITETKSKFGNYDRNRIMIFREDLSDFVDAFAKCAKAIEKIQNARVYPAKELKP